MMDTATISMDKYNRLIELDKRFNDLCRQQIMRMDTAINEIIKADYIEIGIGFNKAIIIKKEAAIEIVNRDLLYEIAFLKNEIDSLKECYKLLNEEIEVPEVLIKPLEPKWYDGLLNLFK